MITIGTVKEAMQTKSGYHKKEKMKQMKQEYKWKFICKSRGKMMMCEQQKECHKIDVKEFKRQFAKEKVAKTKGNIKMPYI